MPSILSSRAARARIRRPERSALAQILALLAAALHVVIFVLESLRWESPRARGVFGTSPEEAAATRELAFNQGFYNLFLAVLAALGAICWFAGADTVGLTLGIAGLGSMLGATLVLFCSSPAQRGAAVKQGILPLLALLSLAVGSLLG